LGNAEAVEARAVSKFREWTMADTERGRSMLRTAIADPSEFDAFMDWIEANVYVNSAEVRRAIGLCVKARDAERALRLYDAMMKDYAPRAQTLGKIANLGLLTFVALGVLGALLAGFQFLWRLVFG
jgi:hypothetical protein